MSTRKLTVRLPEEDIDFAKGYAARHGMTLTELIDRYLRQLRRTPQGGLHPDILRFSGIVPGNIDARQVQRDALEEKHR